MKIIGNKIIVSMEELFPEAGQCSLQVLHNILIFTQTYQSYSQFVPLIFHLTKGFSLEKIKPLHRLIGKSGLIKNLTDIRSLKTAKEMINHLEKLDNILNEYSDIKKLMVLFKTILNQELTIATHQKYLKLFKLFLEFMDSFYPSLKFLKDTFFNGTPVQFKSNLILTNCYTLCEKIKNISLETISEKLMGKELSKSVNTLIINGFSYLSNKTAQQEILNLLFITLKQNRQITHLQFNDSFLDNQSTSYILEGLQNTAVAELIFHKSVISPFYQKNEPAFSSIRKNPNLVSLKCYDCDTPPATCIKEIADVLGNESALSSLHIGGKTASANCSYCSLDNESPDADDNGEVKLINFSAASSPHTASGVLFNDKKDIPDAINYLLKVLAEKNSSFELSLTRKTLSAKNIPAVCQLLKQATNLKKLDLTYNTLGDEFAQVLMSMYIPSENPTQEQAAEFLKITKEISLEELNLSGNAIGDNGCIALAGLLKYNNSIKILKLSDNNITDVGASILAEALHKNTTLEILDLNNNNINDSAPEFLLKAKFKHLFLQGNKLSFNNLVAVVEILTANQFLKSISFDLKLGNIENKFACEHLRQTLINAVKRNQTLTSLKLFFNYDELAADGKTLADIIRASKSLTELYVMADFSVERLQTIAEALAENNILKSFTWNIDGSSSENYDESEITKIFEILKQNTALTTFDISWWAIEGFPKKYQQILENLLERNRLLAAFLPEAPVVPQFSLLKFREYSKTDFWKFEKKTKFPFPATQDYATVQDNIRCSVGVYHLGGKLGSPLLQKLLKRHKASDISVKFSYLLTNFPINVSKELETQTLNDYDPYLTKDPNMCGYILSQCLVAFSNIQTAHLKKLTEYVNLFQDALLKSDLSATQILEYLNLFHKFFADFDKENLQPALEAVCGSELSQEQQKNIRTMVYILNRLQKDINLTQELLNKCHKLINAKIETQLPKPDEEITRTFISQLQSKH